MVSYDDEKKIIYVVLLNCISLLALNAKEIIQFSGYVHDAESGSVVPLCTVYIQGENRGTISGYDGFLILQPPKGIQLLLNP